MKALQQLVYPWEGFIARMRWVLRYWRSLRKLQSGICPECNSDSPRFWECPCCSGYDRTTRGLPDNERKLIWHHKWMSSDRYAPALRRPIDSDLASSASSCAADATKHTYNMIVSMLRYQVSHAQIVQTLGVSHATVSAVERNIAGAQVADTH